MRMHQRIALSLSFSFVAAASVPAVAVASPQGNWRTVTVVPHDRGDDFRLDLERARERERRLAAESRAVDEALAASRLESNRVILAKTRVAAEIESVALERAQLQDELHQALKERDALAVALDRIDERLGAHRGRGRGDRVLQVFLPGRAGSEALRRSRRVLAERLQVAEERVASLERADLALGAKAADLDRELIRCAERLAAVDHEVESLERRARDLDREEREAAIARRLCEDRLRDREVGRRSEGRRDRSDRESSRRDRR